MADNETREDTRFGDGDDCSSRRPDHEAQEQELLRKLPDETSPDQERGERHATGKGTATGGANQNQGTHDRGD